jgi:hypothetical protein
MKNRNLTCKIFSLVLVFSFSIFSVIAATRYSVATGNWNANSTWSTTSGGAPGASFPVAGDIVYIENGHTVTITANAACASITFTGESSTLTVNSGYIITVSNTVTLIKQSAVNSVCTVDGAGTMSCANISVGSTLNPPSGNNNVYTFTFACSIAVLNISGNLTVNSYYTGGAVKASGNGVFNLQTGVVTVSGSVITTAENNKNAVTFSMATGSNNGTLILESATPFTLDPQSTIIDLNGTSTTVIYNRAGAQTLNNTSYRNITLSGSGVKTIANPGNVNVFGTLSMEGTATLSGKTPVYNANATLQYKGSASQTTGLEFPTTFDGSGGVIINNSNGIVLNSSRTINSILTFVNGKCSTGTNMLILGSGATVTGAAAGNYVYGNLQKGVATGTTTKTFEIGDATAYTPIVLSFSGTITVAGNIMANTTSGDHPNINTSIITPTVTVNRYWTISNSGVSGFTSYDVTFYFVAADVDAGADYNYFMAGNYNAPTWTYPNVGTRTSLSTQATGLGTSGFGAFQIGMSLINSFRSIATGNWNQASTWERYSAGSWVAAVTPPSSASGVIIIRSPNTVTNTAPVTVDQVIIDPSGSLVINSDMVVADGEGTDMTVNGILDCGAAFALTGTGSFVLFNGADLIIRSTSGITSSGATGNIQTSIRTFMTGANYSYSGTASQVTGNGLPSVVNNLTINNSAGVMLTSSLTTNGILTLTSGALTVGSNTLTLQTSDVPIIRTSGTLSTSSGSNLSFGSAGNTGGAAFNIPAGTFTAAPIINNLTIFRANSLTLNEQMTSVEGIVLCNGPLSTNNNLLLLSTATRTALIDGSGTGTITGNVTMQRYLPSGFGYKYFSSPFQAATVNEFADDMDLGAAFTTFYKYDENRIVGGNPASGWVNYKTTTNVLNPVAGYAVNFGSSAVPNTVDVTGVVTNGNKSVTLYNHNNPYTLGFNLIGNPYPSPIDWKAAAGWTKTNIDDALYYFKATDQYGGTYSTYINGASSDGLASNIIPSMQGFFVHVAGGGPPWPITGTLVMDNNVRITDQTHGFLKSAMKGIVPLIRFASFFSDDTASFDPFVLYVDEKATDGFDSQSDALKLFNTDLKVPNLYAVSSGGANLSIDALPVIEPLTVVPLGLKINRSGEVVFKIRDIESYFSGMTIFLSDVVAGIEKDLVSGNEYKVNLTSGVYTNRFYLNFKNGVITGDNQIAPDDESITVFSSPGVLKANIKLLPEGRGVLKLSSLTGQVLLNQNVYESGYYEYSLDLRTGIYIATFISGNIKISRKLFIQGK